ncbi:hypothetical protein BISA_2319 [Bifidobacterium saguini DSM 23967]|uniref:Uncharacterized protein n=1 Tax=Bifidobacterium saguini DSM 23967 TaxID=1437607 RepID=A0A087D8Q0_9BIFI|nr:hypothetical protein BISA_2319 [Bifidobacterium saguini DSM 23967]
MNNLHEPAHPRKSHISKQAKTLEKTSFARRVENAVFNLVTINIAPKTTTNCLNFVSYRRVPRKFTRTQPHQQQKTAESAARHQWAVMMNHRSAVVISQHSRWPEARRRNLRLSWRCATQSSEAFRCTNFASFIYCSPAITSTAGLRRATNRRTVTISRPANSTATTAMPIHMPVCQIGSSVFGSPFSYCQLFTTV